MKEAGVKNKAPIFVIGYPKSGNTWLARMLAEITLSKINATNPVDAADNLLGREGNYVITKLHDTGVMILPKDVRVVYIMRDIRDVLVSAFFFNNRFICEDLVRVDSKCGGSRHLLSKIYFKHQIKRMNKRWCGHELSGLMNWIHGNKKTIGDWSSHIRSWAQNPNVVVVKYEELLRDAEGEMKRILGELEINVSDDILKSTILNQSFQKKKAEFLRSGNYQNSQFLRAGKAGGWSEFLSPDMVKEIEFIHASVMNEYGYSLEFPEVEK